MTSKADFTEQEWELVRAGPPTAGMITLLASSGGTFRETWALAKTFAEARQQCGQLKQRVDAAGDAQVHAGNFLDELELGRLA